jgi:hypothetical protein
MFEKYAAFQMMPFPGSDSNKAGISSSVYGQTETPSPFFTISGQFLPRDLNGIVRWSYFLISVEPLISEVIRKLASYPITEFVIDTPDQSLKKKYEDICYSLDLKSKLTSVGFDYYLIGNVFVSIYFPFVRMAVCPNCGSSYRVDGENITWNNFQFGGSCMNDGCGYTGHMDRSDRKSKDPKDVNLVVYDPRDMSVNYNPISGKSDYWLTIPDYLREKVTAGDKFIISTTPWSMIEAIRDSKEYHFFDDSIYHLKMPGVTNALPGLGVPPLIGAWDSVYNKAMMRRANSAIASELMMPLRIVFPDLSGGTNPTTAMSLQSFAKNMRTYLARHKTDPLAAVMSPIPVGYQEITGNGKQLLITQEIDQIESYLLLSLGVSKELLDGTLSWTASTVGLRLFRNTLLKYTEQIHRLIAWIFKKISPEFGLDPAEVTLEPFQLTDNDGMVTTLMQLASQNIVSQETALASISIDYDDEQRKIQEEQIEAAKQSVVLEQKKQQAAWSQTREQQAGGTDNYKTALEEAGEAANQLISMEEGPRRSALMQLKVQDPAQYMLVSKLIEEFREDPQYQEQVKADGTAAAQDIQQQGGQQPQPAGEA